MTTQRNTSTVAAPGMPWLSRARTSHWAALAELVVAGYALTSAVFLITAARLGDQIGRRRTFSIGLGLLILASVACEVAGTPAELVLARLAQGVGAALPMPHVLAMIGVTYTGLHLARALGAYGFVPRGARAVRSTLTHARLSESIGAPAR